MMMQKKCCPFLRRKWAKMDLFESRYLRFFGWGVSISNHFENLIEEQTNPTIAPYAGKFKVMLRLTANRKTEECTELLDGMELLINRSRRNSSMDMGPQYVARSDC